MSTCQLDLVPLSCDRTGVGFTARPLSSDSNKLYLQNGHANSFPQLEGQQYFYVRISGCKGCCEVAKVIGREGDILILDRVTGSKCECIMSNSMVKYEWDNIQVVKDIAHSIGINVISPLRYDACTRTLSVDCKELFAKDCGGCGCNEGATPSGGGGATGGTPGLRGPKGDAGERGVGVTRMSVSATGQLMYELSDGTMQSAGQMPLAKAVPGPQGDRGEKGPPGDKGEDGPRVDGIVMQGTKAVFSYTDDSTQELDVSSLKGDKGDTGDQGPKGDKGDKGDTGLSVQYVESGAEAYIFGPANTALTITSPKMPGVTLGPFITDGEGFVEIPKPQLSGNAVIKISAGGRLVGIGKVG